MKARFSFIFFLFLISFFFSKDLLKPVEAQTRVRLMVVGDSISQGHSGDYTWRYRLWQHLTASGVSVDFVGPRNTVQDDHITNSTDYLDPNFDKDHNALWGRPIVWEKDSIDEVVLSENPDILLINLGTNDLAWFGMTGEQAANEMTQLINNARAVNPNIKIVLSTLTPRYQVGADYTARWSDFNDRIAAFATTLSTPTSSIVIADPVTGFDPAVDTYDSTHPSPSGEYKIAAAFANALASGFSIGNLYGSIPSAPIWPQAPATVTSVAGNGEATISWTPVVGAGEYDVYVRNMTRNESFPQSGIRISEYTYTYTKTGLTNGETYEFGVKTRRGEKLGSMTTPVRVTPSVPVPTMPPTLVKQGTLPSKLNNGPAKVPVTGLVAGAQYKVVITGKYKYQAYTNASETDAQWDDWGGPFNCYCRKINKVVFNGQALNADDYQTIANPNRAYTYSMTLSGTQLEMYITDGYYGDNQGSLEYKIYRVGPVVVPGELVSSGQLQSKLNNGPAKVIIGNLIPGAKYTAIISGTYKYQMYTNASRSDAQWDDWGGSLNCYCRKSNKVLFNGVGLNANDYQTSSNPNINHPYTYSWIATGTQLELYITDGYYGDNQGFLDYKLYFGTP